MKGAISGKRQLEDISSVLMNEECSTILNPREKLSQKLKDLGSLTIIRTLGLTVSRDLADLGTRINLMPYDIFQNLGVGEPKPARMSIQLAIDLLNILRVLLMMCLFR